MHFYGASHSEAMALKIKTFWLMSECVDRILAQQDMRALTLEVIGNTDSDCITEHRKRLVIEVGTIAKIDEMAERTTETLDSQGLAELKGMLEE
jgi:hypothetical protein